MPKGPKIPGRLVRIGKKRDKVVKTDKCTGSGGITAKKTELQGIQKRICHKQDIKEQRRNNIYNPVRAG
jgi:hypothetical protein